MSVWSQRNKTLLIFTFCLSAIVDDWKDGNVLAWKPIVGFARAQLDLEDTSDGSYDEDPYDTSVDLEKLKPEQKLAHEKAQQRRKALPFYSEYVPANVKVKLPLLYADVNEQAPAHKWDYVNHPKEPEIFSTHDFIKGKPLGGGKYSNAFETEHKDKKKAKKLGPLAYKQLKGDAKWDKIKREVNILDLLWGGPNIIKLQGMVQEDWKKADPDWRPVPDPKKDDYVVTETNHPANVTGLLFELIPNQRDYKTFYPTLSMDDIRYYIRELLIALDYVHSNGIMHRDVKPYNIVIDHEKKRLRLIDFGLSEFYHPRTSFQLRVAARYYKGPELLVGLGTYHYTLDIWSLGCVFAAMLFRKFPLFKGSDDMGQLVEIVKVLGTDDLQKYLDKYDWELQPDVAKKIGTRPRQKWRTFINDTNKEANDRIALDLLDKMLRYDHQERILPREALYHPFFKSLDGHPGYPTEPDRGLTVPWTFPQEYDRSKQASHDEL